MSSWPWITDTSGSSKIITETRIHWMHTCNEHMLSADSIPNLGLCSRDRRVNMTQTSLAWCPVIATSEQLHHACIWDMHVGQTIGLAKRFTCFFCKMLWKNLNELFGQLKTKVKTEAAPGRWIKMNAEMAITGQKRTGWNQFSQSKIHCTNNSVDSSVTTELVSLACLLLG